MLTLLAVAWALLGGIVAPGWLLAGRPGPGGGGLERLVVAIALGRIALALLALAAATLGLLPLLPALALLALVAVAWRTRGALRSLRPPALSTALASAALLAASAWVAHTVGGRSGLPDGSGDLLFFGRHTTNDPLVYMAMAARIAEVGWPVGHPFVAGLPNLGHALWFGEILGIQALSGASWLDVVFRIRPHFDVATLVLTAFALGRALGAGVRGAAAGALLLLFGGGLSQLLFWGTHAVGVPANLMEIWQISTGFLLPFNPIAPALQTGFAALLILARCDRSRRTPAFVAGLLVAALFEFKVFLWAGFFGGLAMAALWRPPPASAPTLRRAATAALLVSLPLVVHKAVFAAGLGESADVRILPCVGCVPRFALDSAFGDPFVLVQTFESFHWGALAQPRWWAVTATATLLWLLVTGGARVAALPPLWRGAFRTAPEQGEPVGAVAVYRTLAGAGLLGLGAACVLSSPPHHLNVVQFAWSAWFGLWIVLGVRVGAWLQAGRRGVLLLVAVLALPTGLFWLLHQGAGAPVYQRTSWDERVLMERLAEASDVEALVLEPSARTEPLRLSPVAWLAHRQVYFSTLGAAFLPEAERSARTELVARVFGESSRETALAAIREAGADWVYAPTSQPLRFDPRPELEREHANAAGTLWRVVGPDPVRSGRPDSAHDPG